MLPPARGDSSRKHPRDEDSTNDDMPKKRKSSDRTLITTTNRSAGQDVADAKARIQEMMKKSLSSSAVAGTIAAAQARVAAQSAVMQQNVQALAKAEEDTRQAKGGLAVNVHPSLLANLPTSIDRRNRGHVAPKFSTTLANLNRQ